MYIVVLDMTNILVHCSVIDALVNVVMDVSMREAASEVIVHSLADFLVAIVARFVSTTSMTSVPTTVVSMNLSVVVVVLLPEGIRRVIMARSTGPW